MQICPSFCQKFPVSPDPAGLGRAAIIHFITSHVSLSASLHSQTRAQRVTSVSQSHAELCSVLTNGRRDLGVGPGPVISVARPRVAKTRRLQNICATHPEPELRRSLETGRGEGNWRLETFLSLGNF